MLAAKKAMKAARKTLDKAFKGDVEENFIGMAPQAVAEEEVEESGLQAYLGKKKYGEKGMKALQQAGRDGASKEKMASIRAKHDKLDEVQVEEDLDANQKRAGQLGPTEKVKNNTSKRCYSGNEQHAGCSPFYAMESREASENECRSLKIELIHMGIHY